MIKYSQLKKMWALVNVQKLLQVLSQDQVTKFILENPDGNCLLTKIIVRFGNDLIHLTFEKAEDNGGLLVLFIRYD